MRGSSHELVSGQGQDLPKVFRVRVSTCSRVVRWKTLVASGVLSQTNCFWCWKHLWNLSVWFTREYFIHLCLTCKCHNVVKSWIVVSEQFSERTDEWINEGLKQILDTQACLVTSYSHMSTLARTHTWVRACKQFIHTQRKVAKRRKMTMFEYQLGKYSKKYRKTVRDRSTH